MRIIGLATLSMRMIINLIKRIDTPDTDSDTNSIDKVYKNSDVSIVISKSSVYIGISTYINPDGIQFINIKLLNIIL
jgi:ERCC4-related helicase